MRGKTYQFNVNQIAGRLAVSMPKAKAETVAKRACDIVDAVYAETRARNEVDAEAIENGDDTPTLHSAEDILKAAEGDDDDA